MNGVVVVCCLLLLLLMLMLLLLRPKTKVVQMLQQVFGSQVNMPKCFDRVQNEKSVSGLCPFSFLYLYVFFLFILKILRTGINMKRFCPAILGQLQFYNIRATRLCVVKLESRQTDTPQENCCGKVQL